MQPTKTDIIDKRKTAALSFLTSISANPIRSSPVFVNPIKPLPVNMEHLESQHRETAVLQFLGNIEINIPSNLMKAASVHALGETLENELADLGRFECFKFLL